MTDIVIFHNIHHPKSWELVHKVLEDETVEIIDWFGDIEARDAWRAENPLVGPTVLPTVWIKVPAYRAPYIVYYLVEPKESYEPWETPGIEEIFEGDFVNIPEHWELHPEEVCEWDDILAKRNFYKDRAALLPPEE